MASAAGPGGPRPILVTPDERRKQDARAKAHQRRMILRQLAKPSLAARVKPKFLGFLAQNEGIHVASVWSAWLLAAALCVGESVRGRIWHKSAFLYGHPTLAAILSVASLLLMVLIFLDLATYRPRVFHLADSTSRQFFDEIGALSGALRAHLSELASTPARTWASASAHEENLLWTIKTELILDRLQAVIIRRVFVRLGGLVISLGLLCYGISYATSTGVISEVAPGAGFSQHLYFTIVTFFTIGFGELSPVHGITGYMFVGIAVTMFVAITYFLFNEVMASHYEFRSNVRVLAKDFVCKSSML